MEKCVAVPTTKLGLPSWDCSYPTTNPSTQLTTNLTIPTWSFSFCIIFCCFNVFFYNCSVFIYSTVAGRKQPSKLFCSPTVVCSHSLRQHALALFTIVKVPHVLQYITNCLITIIINCNCFLVLQM